MDTSFTSKWPCHLPVSAHVSCATIISKGAPRPLLHIEFYWVEDHFVKILDFKVPKSTQGTRMLDAVPAGMEEDLVDTARAPENLKLAGN